MDLEEIIREYIDKTVHMSLATVSGDAPWVCEVHFAYDNDLNLYFVSKPDTRHCKEIASNPKVAGNVIKQHSLEESPHGIYFEGSAGIIDNPSDEEISRYCSRLGRNSAEVAQMLAEKDGRKMYKIVVKNWATFGKFGGDTNTKNELRWNGGQK